eukprot:TRINITY_DN7434_c0_g2_i1.p1 TRINITY_DN7434_c0_g2~~TRINITY_DN7434_c0_g2_i1.p1  ORF type:complete len:297 (+),score=85.37 TRINITY_DN7434_c0_g2_i1:81-893(+)
MAALRRAAAGSAAALAGASRAAAAPPRAAAAAPSAPAPLPRPLRAPQRRSIFGFGKKGEQAAAAGRSSTPILDAQAGRDPVVFLDIEIGGEKAGRIEIELSSQVVPRAAENFLALCTGVYATYGGPADGASRGGTAGKNRALAIGNLHYAGTNFHRVLPGFLVQGGDNEHFDGTGGWSVFQTKFFEDESHAVPFEGPGVVAMATEAPNRNAAQFFIVTAADGAPQLQHKYVAIGRVVNGMDVVRRIEEEPTDHLDCPVRHVKIAASGQLY